MILQLNAGVGSDTYFKVLAITWCCGTSFDYFYKTATFTGNVKYWQYDLIKNFYRYMG